MRVYLKDGEGLADLEVHLEGKVLVLVVQVKALGEEAVLRNIINPHRVPQCLGEAQLGSDHSILLEVVDQLEIQ